MINRSLFASAFGVGLAITLISGLVDTTPSGILGATWHGWPLVWSYVIVYPGSPWSVNWVNFAGDILLWSVVSFVVIWSLLILRHKQRE
jgi:hypothetical protein